MTTQELNAKTVLELRKIAKENGVKLGAGVSKSDIVAKIAAATAETAAAPQAPAATEPVSQEPAPAQAAAPAAPAAPAAEEKPSQPQFRQAWSNPSAAPRYNAKPAYQAPAYPQRQSSNWQQQRPANRVPAPQTDLPRMQTVRPQRYTPRFGPNAGEPVTVQPQQEEYRPQAYREPPRPAYNAPERPAYAAQDRAPYQPDRSYSEPARPVYEQPSFEQAPQSAPYENQYQRPGYPPRRENNYYQQDSGMNAAELMTAAECADGSGVLELHPEGYGFLRSDNFLPSSKDIYVSMAQIRRFGLRTGDYVVGKTRPQRDGDKYAAMLYITEVNGETAENLIVRPAYEDLTPVYPSRRIDLESHDDNNVDTMRLADLIAPLGFGQRGLILCPPDTGKPELLRDFANAITRNYPDVTVMVLLIDENPEDVTYFREQVKCPVLASTFDQPPENHLRLADIVLERAQRLVEQGKDVVIIADSLTRLAKTYTTTAAQQGRGLPGMVNPTSLFRAKKLFGAARCMKEGGSLTVIGTMNIETGNKVDDTIVEEFKGTANMELWLDASVARAGVSPAINLQLSGTKRAEMLLTKPQMEGLQLIRSIMTSTRSVTAIPQLLSMMDKAGDNDELMVRIKDWVSLMSAKA